MIISWIINAAEFFEAGLVPASLRTALARSVICGPVDMPRSPGGRRRECIHSCAIRQAPDHRRQADRFAAEFRQRTAPARLPEADEPVPSECADRARRPARSAARCQTADRPLKPVEAAERRTLSAFQAAYRWPASATPR